MRAKKRITAAGLLPSGTRERASYGRRDWLTLIASCLRSRLPRAREDFHPSASPLRSGSPVIAAMLG